MSPIDKPTETQNFLSTVEVTKLLQVTCGTRCKRGRSRRINRIRIGSVYFFDLRLLAVWLPLHATDLGRGAA